MDSNEYSYSYSYSYRKMVHQTKLLARFSTSS